MVRVIEKKKKNLVAHIILSQTEHKAKCFSFKKLQIYQLYVLHLKTADFLQPYFVHVLANRFSNGNTIFLLNKPSNDATSIDYVK